MAAIKSQESEIMSDYKHFCSDSDLMYYLKGKGNFTVQNIKMLNFLRGNVDSTISEAKHLRYFKKPPLSAYPLDLSENADEYVYRNIFCPNSSLSFVEYQLMQKDILNVMPEITTKICTSRSTLIKIMLLTIFKDDLILNVTKFKDTLYLSVLRNYETNKTLVTKLHYKFAQICFADNPKAEPVTNKPVNENELWRGIYRCQLRNFDIIYSSEVLGVDADEEIKDLSDLDKLNECNVVLLRLCRKKIHFARALRTFLQAKFVNSNDLYVANKSNVGIVTEPIQRVNIETIIRNPAAIWKKCNGFLLNLLENVNKKMEQVDCPYTVYRFMHVASEKRFKLKIFNGKNDFTILSEDFIQHILQREI